MGWGSNGVETVASGAIGAQLGSMKRGQVDGVVLSASQGYGLEKTGDGRLFTLFGAYIKNFHTHVIFATDDMIAEQARSCGAFSPAGRRQSRIMAANKARTVRVARAGHRP